jgi:hypothetical protein
LVSKRSFKEIDFISLPEIYEESLYSNSNNSLNELYNEFKIPGKFREQLNKNLTDKKLIKD